MTAKWISLEILFLSCSSVALNKPSLLSNIEYKRKIEAINIKTNGINDALKRSDKYNADLPVKYHKR